MIMRLLYWLMSRMRGGEDMMAMFFAQRVILDKTKFSEVPASLQAGVKEILVDSGLGYMAE